MRKIVSVFLAALILVCCLIPALANDVDPESCTHGSYEWIEDEKATCETPGTMHLVCTLCGQTVSGTEGTVVSATGHSWKADEEFTSPCVTRFICENENCTEEKFERLLNAQHEWMGSEIKEPTCGAAGYIVYTCTTEHCNVQKTEAVAATGNHVDADGNQKCDNCGANVPSKKGMGITITDIFLSFYNFFVNLFSRIGALFS